LASRVPPRAPQASRPRREEAPWVRPGGAASRVGGRWARVWVPPAPEGGACTAGPSARRRWAEGPVAEGGEARASAGAPLEGRERARPQPFPRRAVGPPAPRANVGPPSEKRRPPSASVRAEAGRQRYCPGLAAEEIEAPGAPARESPRPRGGPRAQPGPWAPVLPVPRCAAAEGPWAPEAWRVWAPARWAEAGCWPRRATCRRWALRPVGAVPGRETRARARRRTECAPAASAPVRLAPVPRAPQVGCPVG
jgi:hypothetical protein